MTDDVKIKREIKLEDIIALMPGNVYWKTRDGFYLGCNNNTRQTLNLEQCSDIAGKSAYGILPTDYAEVIEQNDEEVMRQDRKFVFEESGYDAEGNQITYHTRKIPLHDDENNVIGLLGISVDISERKRYELALLEEKKKAEAANRSKSEFILNISHDIRTPCSGIIGLSQHLEKTEHDPERKEKLGEIAKSGNKLLNLLNEIIEVIKLEGRTETPHEEVHLRQFLESTTDIIMPAIQHKHLNFSLEIAKDVPDIVFSNRYYLERILLNLLGNSVKFTETGEVKIAIDVTEIDKTEATLRITVSDSGIGIPEDKFSEIFDQFNRLSPSYQEDYEGTGLGLWFVKKLIDRLEGEITVSSQLGKGSTFTCIIPCPLFQHTNLEAQENKPTYTVNIKADMVQRVLLVEDNKIAQKVAQLLLREHLDSPIDVANNGMEALRFCEEHKYQLILMDIGLPDSDGVTLTKKIRELYPRNKDAVIIGLTAHMVDEIQPPEGMNMNMILSKPLSKEMLEKIVIY